MITSFKYDEVGDFHNGMAKVRNGEKWGYINKSGVEVIAFRYEAAGDFHNGRAYVKSKGKYGFIDKYGNVKISFMYKDATDFSFGFSEVNQTTKSIFIDRNGNRIKTDNLYTRRRFHLGYKISIQLKRLKYGDKYNSNKPIKYNVSSVLKNGLRWATIDGSHYGFVNNKGKLKIQLQYDKVNDFHEKRARVVINDKIGFINKKNKRVIPIEYDAAPWQFRNGLIRLGKNGKHGIMNRHNQIIVDFKYDETTDLNQGLVGVKLHDKWGFIDIFEKVIIPIRYENCRTFREGKAALKKDGKWGFVCSPRKLGIISQLKHILQKNELENSTENKLLRVVVDINTVISNEETARLNARRAKLYDTIDSMNELSKEMTDFMEAQSKLDSRPDWQKDRRVSTNEDACILFLQKYGKGELTDSMRRFINSPGDSLDEKYNSWISWSKANNKNYGGKVVRIKTKLMDIDETIIEYEWDGIKGGWPEIFQFVYDIEHSTKGCV